MKTFHTEQEAGNIFLKPNLKAVLAVRPLVNLPTTTLIESAQAHQRACGRNLVRVVDAASAIAVLYGLSRV